MKTAVAAKPLSVAAVTSRRVLARSKSGVTMLRRNRNKEAKRQPAGAQGVQPDRSTPERPRPARVITSPPDERTSPPDERTSPPGKRPLSETAAPAPVARRRREPATEDQAMYSCECGFIFQAAVSTSVGCPHCGGSQAW
jgi:hypothetical protein